jgi:hypothetical protein
LQYLLLKFHPMKPLTATLAFILSITSLSAQIIPVKNELQTDIAKVISDYPNGFRNISGEQVVENPQTREFDSKVLLKDAVKCRVIKYSSNIKDIYSWEAEMLKTDDFEEVSKKFRAIYNSLQHLSVNIDGVNAVFKADYVKPTESIKFTTIVFNVSDKTPELNKLKVALLLETEMLEWVIRIQVYEKERDDKDRGREID